MTPRQIMERVRAHLLTQNKRSVDEDDHCRWRVERPGHVTLMCAVGCLIPEELYTAKMERVSTLEALFACYPDVADAIGATDNNTQLLYELQSVHDHYGPSLWPAALRNVAIKFGIRS
jgi:hypothetical protein